MSRKRGLLISLVGIDGSGKTTAALRLLERMEQEGMPFRYVRFKSNLQISVSQFLHTDMKPASQAFERAPTMRHRDSIGARLCEVGKRAYRALVWSDYVRLFAGRVRRYLMRGENCLCDRYLHDLVVDFLAEDGSSGDEMEESISRIQRIFPASDLVFLFDVPERVAMSRKADVQSVEYLRLRRALYDKLRRLPRVEYIDGTRPLGQVVDEMVDAVLQTAQDRNLVGESRWSD